MPPNDQPQTDQSTWQPPLPPSPPPEPAPPVGDEDYGNEAAVAFARAKLEALLTEQNPQWQPPADPHHLQSSAVVQPPPNAASTATPRNPLISQASAVLPHANPLVPPEVPQPEPPASPPQPLSHIYPTPHPEHLAEITPRVTPPATKQAPELTIPERQYQEETSLQDHLQPQYRHISPDHQLPTVPPEPALPSPALTTGGHNEQFQTMQLSGLNVSPPHQESVATTLEHAEAPTNILPPSHFPSPANENRSDQIKAHTENAHLAVRRFHHGFVKPLLKSTVITAIVFLIYNAPLVMGQVYYYITPASSDPTPVILDPSATSVSAEPRIIISKLNIDVPAVYDETSYSEAKIQQALERGIVHYGTTALPGEKGNAVFLGHSSNSPWAPGRYKTAFSLLRKLQVNDTFVLHYEKKRYIYQVYERKVIDPADFSVISQDVKEPMATLITCDPPGANWNRLVIHARQISPNPADNKPHKGSSTLPGEGAIPGSPPSLWERVTSIF